MARKTIALENANSDREQLATSLPPPLVSRIFGVWKFSRPRLYSSKAFSTPGHLLHYIVKGSSRLTINGKEYFANAGDIVYYYETEEVFNRVGKSRYIFLSIAFDAPTLPCPSAEFRVTRASASQASAFQEILSCTSECLSLEQQIGLYANLFTILREIRFPSIVKVSESKDSLWWELESGIRKHKDYCTSLAELCRENSRSRATIVRACRRATGLSPGNRIRYIRIEEAKGLLCFSTLRIGEIAEYLGYPRMHEFSREFSRHMKMSPSEYRKNIRFSP
jgi:AraC-like DNA-binding protein